MPEGAPPHRTAVCVVGMHRSGTSVVTRLLSLLGVNLGPPEHLTISRKHNLRGYWEHAPLVAVSDEVLALRGGTWDEPPPLPAGWEHDPVLTETRERARRILERDFGSASTWGWKDPRLCLTLPFFRPMLPEPRFVLCVRSPADVASSLERNYSEALRRPFSPTAASTLWSTYVAASLRATGGAPRLLLMYEDLLRDPEGVASRLAEFVGIGSDRISRVGDAVSTDLWHHRSSLRDTVESVELSLPTKTLYVATRLASTSPRSASDGALERLATWCERLIPAPRSVAIETAAPGTGSRGGVSVALCTFNGADHLEEQLASLLAQTRPPDEVVAVDDRSIDGSVEILERFREAAPFPVRLDVNDERVGSTKNFERAIARCSGDVIALCDQDDAWHPEKLRRLESAFTRADVGAVFTDAELVDERAAPTGRRLWDSLEVPSHLWRRFTDGGPRERVEVLCRANLATGATLAFRARYRELILPIPYAWVHDGWITLLVSAVADVVALDWPLVRYRVHGGQQIGTPTLGPFERIVRRADVVGRATLDQRRAFGRQSTAYALAYRRLLDSGDAFPSGPGVLSTLSEKIRHSRTREAVPWTAPRWRTVAGELRTGRYHRFSSGWPSAAKDLLFLDRS